MELDELKVYKIAQEFSECVWDAVKSWNYFEKDTIGKQLIRATDSIAANIAEGFGRFHFNENRLFCYYARGSIYETKAWLTKAFRRKLISSEKYQAFLKSIEDLSIRLNNYIKSIGHPASVHESQSDYPTTE
ncbi:MAG: four helix bundle protein [Candidatus Marinimicrobia bacterium]|jgi:four helix bundle protein|nr:four helix bundle protein [Candidatus Neomarinimicrobiota bacterium]MCK9484047.1 four helix bundle protein [Candidatus Neomarinimicrobiota bacterium]MCK9560161.1 four helix bundle protein [Candidatus Neomarinimicrobiota bacterium]MDD5231303.1 four helix bundle protein [Candidatus Neomarinimicrobiota bacterium]